MPDLLINYLALNSSLLNKASEQENIVSLQAATNIKELQVLLNGDDNDHTLLSKLLENPCFEKLMLQSMDSTLKIPEKCFPLIAQIIQLESLHALAIVNLDLKPQLESFMSAVQSRKHLLDLTISANPEVIDAVIRAILFDEAPIWKFLINWAETTTNEMTIVFKELTNLARSSTQPIKLSTLEVFPTNIDQTVFVFIAELLKKKANYSGLKELKVNLYYDKTYDFKLEIQPSLKILNSSLLDKDCSLEKLIINNTFKNKDNFIHLLDIINYNKSLKFLDCGNEFLFKSDYTIDDFKKIMAELSLNKNIKHFSLDSVSFNSLGSELGKIVAQMLALNTTLKSLNFDNIDLGDKFLIPIIDILEKSKNKNLLQMSILDCNINKEYTQQLEEILKQRQALRKKQPSIVLQESIIIALDEIINNKYINGFLRGVFALPANATFRIKTDGKTIKNLRNKNIGSFIYDKLQQIISYFELYSLPKDFPYKILENLNTLTCAYTKHQSLIKESPRLVIKPKIINEQTFSHIESALNVLCFLNVTMFNNLPESSVEKPKQKIQTSILKFFPKAKVKDKNTEDAIKEENQLYNRIAGGPV